MNAANVEGRESAEQAGEVCTRRVRPICTGAKQPMGEGRRTYWRRRIRRHLVLALTSVGVGAAVYLLVQPAGMIFGLSMATAYAGLLLLAISLLLGPWNVLRTRPNPASTDLRRDVGIWAGILSLAHVFFGLQVHMRGRFWTYFVFGAEERFGGLPRFDLFGLANYTGLAATLVLAGLLALSNDRSLRRLGTQRWKGLQRWNYAAFVLVAVHGAAYQWMETRAPHFVGGFGLLVLLVVALQVVGFRRVRAGGGG